MGCLSEPFFARCVSVGMVCRSCRGSKCCKQKPSATPCETDGNLHLLQDLAPYAYSAAVSDQKRLRHWLRIRDMDSYMKCIAQTSEDVLKRLLQGTGCSALLKKLILFIVSRRVATKLCSTVSAATTAGCAALLDPTCNTPMEEAFTDETRQLSRQCVQHRMTDHHNPSCFPSFLSCPPHSSLCEQLVSRPSPKQELSLDDDGAANAGCAALLEPT